MTLSLSDSIWFCFPKCEFVIDKALQAAEFGLSCSCCFLFFKLLFLWYIVNQKFICHDALNMFLLWSWIEVCFCRDMLKILNFYFDHQSKFICHDTLKIFLLWSSIKVYLPCTENIFTFIINRSIILFTVMWWNLWDWPVTTLKYCWIVL